MVFRIGRLLAEGGIGVVYSARCLRDGRGLAVKVLQQRYALDPELVWRFDRERLFGQRVRHENVISVLGNGVTSDGLPFLVMRRLSGKTLGAIVREQGPLSIDDGLRLADELLAGLSAMHDAGIVHRDLQPENVILEPHATLIDFGFAEEPGTDDGHEALSRRSGAIVGTIRFMAPEQVTGSRAVTPRSDLFGAAVLLYYALSSKLPFDGEDDVGALIALMRRPPIPLRRVRRGVPRRLNDVLLRAMAKHPDARFASASEMRAALAQV